MKRVLISFALMSFATMASAQLYYEDAVNSEMLRHSAYHSESRKEITLPKQLNGYNVYKADLHTHTVYSDGSVTPQLRVQEAWLDGLDVMAVTEHIEYRPFEKTYAEYMGTEVKAADLNYSYRLSESEGKKWGLVIIPGTEITRNGTTVGHFNALFTTDNNTIYDEDPLVAIRNAKAQGALVMHNHPGWTRKDIDYTKTEKAAYKEGLIDGVEVMNTNEFYPGIVDRCREKGLFIAACSDIHGTTYNDYGYSGYIRPLTLILAEDNSLESLKAALADGRTIAVGFNTICGTEALLESFVKASITVTKVDGTDYLMLTNNTSIPFLIQQGDSNPYYLDPFSTARINGKKCKDSVKFTVLNAFVSEKKHLDVKLSF